ncbi:hypothetical protein ACH4FX_42775 [Streptomyces sp. NPDC018019]|uniref:hypothetical protein n=1 Tax=Streptomyces sp. NPDC018019 TaxID=3365030 RepID=UPI003792DAAB
MDELARVSGHLPDANLMRVMAEMDRRDLDAALADARRNLIGALFPPGGRLVADLSAVGDDLLGWAMRYATEDDVERFAAELDRRYPPAPPPAALRGRGGRPRTSARDRLPLPAR